MSYKKEQLLRVMQYLPVAVLLLTLVVSLKYVNAFAGSIYLLGCGRFVVLGGAGIYLLMICVNVLMGRLSIKSFRLNGMITTLLGVFSIAWVILYNMVLSSMIFMQGDKIISQHSRVTALHAYESDALNGEDGKARRKAADNAYLFVGRRINYVNMNGQVEEYVPTQRRKDESRQMDAFVTVIEFNKLFSLPIIILNLIGIMYFFFVRHALKIDGLRKP